MKQGAGQGCAACYLTILLAAVLGGPLRELRRPQRVGGRCQDGQMEGPAVLDAASGNGSELGDHRFHRTELMLEAGQIEIEDLLS